MGLFNRKKEQKTDKQKSAVEVVKETAKKSTVGGKILKKEFSEAYRVLCRPLITEKSVNLSSDKNQYVFAVAPDATKNEVKKTAQDLYGVKVVRVNISNTHGKKRRVGKNEGWKPGFKKATVFLAAGEKIEVMSR